jgi:hypothetical protein
MSCDPLVPILLAFAMAAILIGVGFFLGRVDTIALRGELAELRASREVE